MRALSFRVSMRTHALRALLERSDNIPDLAAKHLDDILFSREQWKIQAKTMEKRLDDILRKGGEE